MRFTKQDAETLTNSIKIALINKGVDILTLERDYKTLELSETRFLWDLYWLSKWSENNRFEASKYNDSHIQTALKNIVKQLKQ